jgi:cell pole-organizing protein PopZ
MSNPQHEPTMEEILASIRKIISEDGPEAAAAPADAAARSMTMFWN